MAENEGLHGLNCPRCGGIVPVPEGVRIVRCSYCEMRSFVQGERGLLRYQVPQRVEQADAAARLQKFLSGSMAIAPAARRQARLTEALLVYLPFWTVWSTVAGWVFGEKKVGSGDDARYQPREVRQVREMTWNGAACDVGEFGVDQVPPVEGDLQPFNPADLHARGMVFEPVGLFSDARSQAEEEFAGEIRSRAGLDRIGQIFVRHLRRKHALVYHPLWVLRYLFRGRAFQVVVDGYTGEVLYGKAPGNTVYRALILALGMAIGAFVAVDAPAFLLWVADFSDDLVWAALALLLIGGGIMFAAYRVFRHGEQYEYRRRGGSPMLNLGDLTELTGSLKDVEKWIKPFT